MCQGGTEIKANRGHSFIIRLWQEPREIGGAAPFWRGFIEHVESGRRRYLRELPDILDFIGPFTVDGASAREEEL